MARKGRVSVPAPTTDTSVTVRKISNGYVVCQSGVSRGKFTTKERFYPKNPLRGAKGK